MALIYECPPLTDSFARGRRFEFAVPKLGNDIGVFNVILEDATESVERLEMTHCNSTIQDIEYRAGARFWFQSDGADGADGADGVDGADTSNFRGMHPDWEQYVFNNGIGISGGLFACGIMEHGKTKFVVHTSCDVGCKSLRMFLHCRIRKSL